MLKGGSTTVDSTTKTSYFLYLCMREGSNKKGMYHITKDCNLNLAEAGIEPRAARLQSSALLSELHNLIRMEFEQNWNGKFLTTFYITNAKNLLG